MGERETRGGRQPPDYRVRTGGPGRNAQRSDMQGNQPIRLPTGQPYGDRQQLRQAQQARPLPQRRGQGGGGGRTGAGRAGGGIMDMLSAPSARPDEPISTGADQPPRRSVVTARGAARIMEETIRDMDPAYISSETLNTLQELQRAALMENTAEPARLEREPPPTASRREPPAPAPDEVV